jgi:hypothetical protein
MLCIMLMYQLYCVVFYYYYLLFLLFVYFVRCLTYVHYFARPLFHSILLLSFIQCSLFLRKIFNSDPGLYSRFSSRCTRTIIIIYASQ